MARLSMHTLANLVATLHISTRRRRKARRDAAAAQQEAATTAGPSSSGSAPVPEAPPLPDSTPVASAAGTPETPAPAADQALSSEPIPMPGMTRQSQPRPLLPSSQPMATEFFRPTHPVFTPRASPTPDLILTTLPMELQLDIMSRLSILDMIAMRDTCRGWKSVVDIPMLTRALTVQNHAGWPIIFEFQGQRYPGTTYGNRRLCGSCLRPKPTRRIIDGAFVAEYLSRRGVERGSTWDVSTGMCWPCLWLSIVEGGKDLYIPDSNYPSGPADSVKAICEMSNADDGGGGIDVPVWKRANIAHTEIFKMMDGSRRRPCQNCAKDIHTNEVPCQYCTDFTQWLRHRNCCAEGKPCEDGTQGVVLAR